MMKIAKHAEKRLQQRGISTDALEIIWKHGRIISTKHGAAGFFFGRKEYAIAMHELKGTMKLLERARNGVVIAKNGTILTVYKKRHGGK